MNKEFGYRVGVTQEELAAVLGVTRPHIGNLEIGAESLTSAPTKVLLARGHG